jgi:cell shape-determining protein MreC
MRISSRVCELCNPRDFRAMRVLESLTPSGSEFVNDPEACVAFVRDRLAHVIQIAKERNALRAENDTLKAQLNSLGRMGL